MIHLYSPKDEMELMFIRSILDGENIPYYVENDHYGSLYTGVSVPLFNQKNIMVDEGSAKRADELIADYLQKTAPQEPTGASRYSWKDTLRMLTEFFLFGWIMPGRKWSKKKTDEE